MSDSSNVDDLLHSIEELTGNHLSHLTEKLENGGSISELAEGVGQLNDLLISYKLQDELLERVLVSNTPEARRKQILETLNTQRMKVEETSRERVHTRSHQILDRSARLIAKMQRQIDKRRQAYRLPSGNMRSLRWLRPSFRKDMPGLRRQTHGPGSPACNHLSTLCRGREGIVGPD